MSKNKYISTNLEYYEGNTNLFPVTFLQTNKKKIKHFLHYAEKNRTMDILLLIFSRTRYGLIQYSASSVIEKRNGNVQSKLFRQFTYFFLDNTRMWRTWAGAWHRCKWFRRIRETNVKTSAISHRTKCYVKKLKIFINV